MQSAACYKVNARGFATNVVLPARQVSLGLKYFKEFSNRSTFQGYTLRISGGVTLLETSWPGQSRHPRP